MTRQAKTMCKYIWKVGGFTQERVAAYDKDTWVESSEFEICVCNISTRWSFAIYPNFDGKLEFAIYNVAMNSKFFSLESSVGLINTDEHVVNLQTQDAFTIDDELEVEDSFFLRDIIETHDIFKAENKYMSSNETLTFVIRMNLYEEPLETIPLDLKLFNYNDCGQDDLAVQYVAQLLSNITHENVLDTLLEGDRLNEMDLISSCFDLIDLKFNSFQKQTCESFIAAHPQLALRFIDHVLQIKSTELESADL